jgi:hypothetical protein
MPKGHEMSESTSALQDRVKELKLALKDRTAKGDEIVAAIDLTGNKGLTPDNPIDPKPEQREAFTKTMGEVADITAELKGIEALLKGHEYLESPDGTALAIAAGAGLQGGRGMGGKSVGQLFCDSPEFKELQGGKAGYTMRAPFELGIADLGSYARSGKKDIYDGLASPAFPAVTGFGPVQRDPFVPIQNRRTRVRDLFAVQQTSASVIEYFRVSGFTNNASVVPERASGNFAAKPHSTLAFAAHATNVRTIAHWEVAHRNTLSDEPQLRGIIDTELLYGLQLHEDYQILSGTGTGEDLPGILNDGGLQTYAQSSGPGTDNKADALRRALTKVLLAYYEPTGIVVYDQDWEDIELTKNSQGTYLFLTALALGVEPRLFRVPVATSPAMPDNTALVGAFGLGAQLYDREEATVRIAEQHSDFFIRNAVVVLAEERLALATKRPESFVKVTFS